MSDQDQTPPIFMPAEAATATGPEGRHLLFFTVPQLELLIKRTLAQRPKEYTYRWAYHPGHKIHVLLFGWPEGESAGLAIPEGAGDMVLNFMRETTDVFLTTESVQERLQGEVDAKMLQDIMKANTVYLPGVTFTPEA